VQRNDNRAGERRGRRVSVFRKLTAVIPKVEELRTRFLEHYTHKQCEEQVNFTNTIYFETVGVLENLITILILQAFRSKKEQRFADINCSYSKSGGAKDTLSGKLYT
jgi:hypothetical protein